MTGITYPSGRKLSYSFDALGRVTGVTSVHQLQTKTLASNITYLPFGPMTSLNYGSGKTLTQTYDLDYRLINKTTSGLKEYGYNYDLINNITRITDGQNSADNQTFTYDKLSRLLTAKGGYGDMGYDYDKIGNRSSKTDNANTSTYKYASDSHRLLEVVGWNSQKFTHDAAGNTLTRGELSFSYNQQGRMKTASKTGMNANYLYNFKGERSAKLVNGVQTHFIFDLNGQLIAEADSNGVVQREYVYLNGQRLASLVNDTLYYVHTDHLGTPIALTDEAGLVQWQASYTPFGKTVVEVNNIDNNSRFPGQYFDSETGLHYNYFRDYDPEIGRYIQSDPIGLNGGINTYGYVAQNPINLVDPDGLRYRTVRPKNRKPNGYQPGQNSRANLRMKQLQSQIQSFNARMRNLREQAAANDAILDFLSDSLARFMEELEMLRQGYTCAIPGDCPIDPMGECTEEPQAKISPLKPPVNGCGCKLWIHNSLLN